MRALALIVFAAQLACGARVAPEDLIVDSSSHDAVTRDTAINDTSVDTFVPGCTATEPAPGAACAPLGEPCKWPSKCGGVDRGVCTTAGWAIERGPCPPATKDCPATRPPDDTSCARTSEVCLYSNACGGVVAATCSTGVWSVTHFPCKPGCPSAPPDFGGPCKEIEGVKTCDYTFGPRCSFSCFCYLEHWACYGTPCTNPPVGSGLGDAG